MRRGYRLGRTLLTTTIQGAGAPVVDSCTTVSEDTDGTMHTGGGIAIRHRPSMGRALVLARAGTPAPSPAQLARWFGRRLTTSRGHRA